MQGSLFSPTNLTIDRHPIGNTKILFYVDSPAMIMSSIQVAESLKKKLHSHIVMVVVDKSRYKDKFPGDYEIYDFTCLFDLDHLENQNNIQDVASHDWRLTLRRTIKRARYQILRAIFQVLRYAWRSLDYLTRRLSPIALMRIAWYRARKHAFRLSNHSQFFFIIHAASRSIYLRLNQYSKVASRYWIARALLFILLVPFRLSYRLLKKFYIVLLPIKHSVSQFMYWLRGIVGISAFLRYINPDAIILTEDNIETFTRVVVGRGKAMGIPTFIIPNTIPNPLEPAQFYESDPRHQANTLIGRTLAVAQPKWAFDYNGKSLLRLPVAKALAIEFMGLSTAAPWLLNRGSASAIVLDSDALRDRYISLGFPPEQLAVIGNPVCDILNDGLRNKQRHLAEIYRVYALEHGRPLVVCGFPPNQYGNESSKWFEFANFNALIEAWMSSLQEIGNHANVLVSPHPRLEPEQLARYESRTVKVTMLPTSRLVPLCDIYVASISATIRWAVACGIPTINYDTYQYWYGDYDGVEGVITVQTIDEFRAHLKRFVEDPEYATALKSSQRRVMRYWGLVDDRFPDRLRKLVTDKIASRSIGS